MVMNKDKSETPNIGYVKEHFSTYVTKAEKGGKTLICRRNQPVAELGPVATGPTENRTRLGSARGSVAAKVDLTQPAIPEKDWNALT
jgi:antitoxin (DNA-binding transcriptional repressor) of toxin-antitoxin stability system